MSKREKRFEVAKGGSQALAGSPPSGEEPGDEWEKGQPKEEILTTFGVSDDEVKKVREEIRKHAPTWTTRGKRNAFLKVLRKTANISVACAVVGISRETYNRWLKENDKFNKRVEEVFESRIDFAESAAFMAAGSRERWAVELALKSARGRKRGWGISLELTGPGGEPIQPKLYIGVDDTKFPEPKEK